MIDPVEFMFCQTPFTRCEELNRSFIVNMTITQCRNHSVTSDTKVSVHKSAVMYPRIGCQVISSSHKWLTAFRALLMCYRVELIVIY